MNKLPLIFMLIFHCRHQVAAKYVGNWEHTLLGISGSIHFESPTKISLRNFHFDGSNVDLYLYFYDESGNVGTYKGNYLYLEAEESRQDFHMFDKPYVNETVLAFMPSGKTVCDVKGLAIWSIKLDKLFSLIYIEENDVYEKRPRGECNLKDTKTTYSNTTRTYDNCEPILGSANTLFNIHWSLDTREEESKLHVKLCMCDATATSKLNFYMAFGRSGPNENAPMTGGDVTVTWMDKKVGRPQAVDYFLRSRKQCQNGEGVCPDAYFTNDNCTDDIIPGSVSGGIKGSGEICVAYSKLLQTSDSKCDVGLDPDIEEPMIIAAGYLGNSVLKHFSYNNDIRIKFGRKPRKICMSLVCPHDCVKFSSHRLNIPHSSTLDVRTYPAGLDQGYNSITGQPNSGNVAFFINNTLIPELVVRRGQTYTFEIQGGYNHPFYITSSKTGGWLRKSTQERQKETIYAGFDSTGIPSGAGRLCRSTFGPPTDSSRCWSDQSKLFVNSFLCPRERFGVFSWTPDHLTPDKVYYQCAQHLNHGWRIVVQPEIQPTPKSKSGELNSLVSLTYSIIAMGF